MPTLTTMQASTPKCPECDDLLRWDHGCGWWNCPSCKTHVEGLGSRFSAWTPVETDEERKVETR